MCTLSWIPHVNGDTPGYTLGFNRDERITRAAGAPPALRHAAGVAYLAPLDTEAGGTWLAVNAWGVCLALLNRYGSDAVAGPVDPISRGFLVSGLIDVSSVRMLEARLAPLPLSRYQPFTLASVEPGSPVHAFEWNGVELRHHVHREPGLALVSSGHDQPGAEAARRRTAAALFQREGLGSRAVEALHASHEPARGAYSVCMHRADAETRSYSRIEVGPELIEFHHVNDAPCRGIPVAPLRLPRLYKPAASVAGA